MVGGERRHGRRSFAGAQVRSASASRGGGGVVVRGGGLVGRVVNEALEAGLRRGSGAPHHHRDFIGTASATRERVKTGGGLRIEIPVTILLNCTLKRPDVMKAKHAR